MKRKSFPIRLSRDIGKGGPLPHGGWSFSDMWAIRHSAQILGLLQKDEAELRSADEGQDLPSEVGKDVAQDAASNWSGTSLVSPAGPGKGRARWRNDDSVKDISPYLLLELVSLSRVREIYPGLALDIDAKHLEVEAFCSAELFQAALHIPLSRCPRE